MEIIKEKNYSKISIYTRMIRKFSPFHWHQNYEICQVVKKACGFFVNGTFIEAAEGDIIIIGENVGLCRKRTNPMYVYSNFL